MDLLCLSSFSLSLNGCSSSTVDSAYVDTKSLLYPHQHTRIEHVVTLLIGHFLCGARTSPERLVTRYVPTATLATCWTAGPHITCPLPCITSPTTFSLHATSKISVCCVLVKVVSWPHKGRFHCTILDRKREEEKEDRKMRVGWGARLALSLGVEREETGGGTTQLFLTLSPPSLNSLLLLISTFLTLLLVGRNPE